MYLELAEDASEYIPVNTSAGMMYVRRDLMAEDVTLSQKGKLKALVKKAAPIVGKVAGTALQFAPIPGAGIAGKIISNPKTAALVQKGAAALKKAKPALQKLKPIAAKLKGMPTAAAAIPAAVVAAEAGNAAEQAGGAAGRAAVGDTEGAAAAMEKERGKFGTFVRKYRVPLIIGGVVIAGAGIYLATRKRK